MRISPVGFAADRAALLVRNSTFEAQEEPVDSPCLSAGPHLVSLQIVEGSWRVVAVRHLNWAWYAGVVSLRCVIIHFEQRLPVRVVRRWEGRVQLHVGPMNVLLVDSHPATAPFHWDGSTAVVRLHDSNTIIAALEQLLEARRGA